MPLSYARIAPIQDTTDLAELVRTLNDRINEVNNVFTELETAEAITRGSGGQRTIYNSDLDIGNNRLTNVSPSRRPQDAVTRKELDAVGLLPDTTGELQIQAPVSFNERVYSNAPTSNDGQSFATINDVIGLITLALEGNVAVSRDGDAVTIEDASGANGQTDGTLFMARDGATGKARMLKVINDELVVQSPDVTTLLEILIHEVRKLKIERSH